MAVTIRQFKIIVEQDEDGYFVATVPALPGCLTQGKNMEELKKNVKEAIGLCLEEAAVNPNYARQIDEFAY